MSFTSLPFFLFCFAVLVLFEIVPSRFRWLLLLFASYFFYAFLNVPHLIIVLVAVTFISFFCGNKIHATSKSKYKEVWLWGGILSNISILIWLKYLPFIFDNLKSFLDFFSLPDTLEMPSQLVAIGASYFIFQGISYLIDIYLEVLEPERRIGVFALSLSFFPKLLQGPIERSGSLLPQLQSFQSLRRENLLAGLNLFLWGMFKKVVVADRLAAFVDPIYSNAGEHSGMALFIATYVFALQILFDFSGYTDMALGIARCFNIRLTQNFNSPYVATSTADFWRRWHISFSSWILDYIFKPLQFSSRDWRRWGTPLALIITFIASGIWHGASWCFIVWGMLHGIFLGTGVLFSKQKRNLAKMLRIDRTALLKYWQRFATFNLVCFSWIFFRAETFQDALHIAWKPLAGFPAMLGWLFKGEQNWYQHVFVGMTNFEFLFAVLLVLFAFIGEYLDRRIEKAPDQANDFLLFNKCPGLFKVAAYSVLIYLIAFNGSSAQSFIYLQF